MGFLKNLPWWSKNALAFGSGVVSAFAGVLSERLQYAGLFFGIGLMVLSVGAGAFHVWKERSVPASLPRPKPKLPAVQGGRGKDHNPNMTRQIGLMERLLDDGLPRSDVEVSVFLQSQGEAISTEYARTLLLYMQSKDRVVLADGKWSRPKLLNLDF